MANNPIQVLRSITPSVVPTLGTGATQNNLAYNAKDALLFWLDDLGAVRSLDLTTAGKTWVLQVYTDPADFTAGVTTVLTLPATPASEADIFLYFNGTFQNSTQWSFVGTTLTLVTAIPVGVTEIEVRVFA